jgi:hypothetical protein
MHQPKDEFLKDADAKYRAGVAALDGNTQVFPKKGRLKLSHEDALDNVLEGGNVQDARTLLHNLFQKAAENVGKIDDSDFPGGSFEAYTKTPEFQKGLGVYKENFEAPMREAHQANEGALLEHNGPLNTYYPLSRVEPEPHSSFLGRARSAFQQRQAPRNQFRTGLGEEYDTGDAPLQQALESGLRTNYQGALARHLVDIKLVQPVRPGLSAPDVMTWRGREYNTKEIPLGGDRRGVIPVWAHDELEPILGNQHVQNSILKQILAPITKVSTLGVGEGIFHSANQIGTLVGKTPFVSDSILGKTIGNTPVTKLFTSVANTINQDWRSPEFQAEVLEMAKNGQLPQSYGRTTTAWTKTGKEMAAAMGSETSRTMAPFLFGPGGTDIRGRVQMNLIAKSMMKAEGVDPTSFEGKQKLWDYTNQLGNYNEQLQNNAVRALKSTGFSPFATAATTMLRNGIETWTGTGKMPTNAASYRVAQQLSGGALGLVATWALLSKAYRDKYPWQDKDSKFLQIPLNPGTGAFQRMGTAGKILYGNDASKPGYVNVGFASPLVGRGANALGIAGAYQGTMQHDKPEQMALRASAGPVNALTHLLAGPPVTVGMVGLTGKEPYFVPGRQGGLDLMSAVHGTPKGLGATAWARTKALTGAANPTLSNFEKGSDQDLSILRTIIDIGAPGLLKGPFKRPKGTY